MSLEIFDINVLNNCINIVLNNIPTNYIKYIIIDKKFNKIVEQNIFLFSDYKIYFI